MTHAAIFEGLVNSKLAIEMTEQQRKDLAAVMTLRNLAPGEVLVKEGDIDDHLYVISSGVVGIIKAAGTENEMTINTVKQGDVLGELSFLDGATRYASLVAMSSSQVLGLSRGDLETLLDTNPHLVYRVMRAIVRVVHDIQRRLTMQTVELTNYLYKTHGRY